MTREEIYSTIYTHEEIYRPPQEEGCACLEVARMQLGQMSVLRLCQG